MQNRVNFQHHNLASPLRGGAEGGGVRHLSNWYGLTHPPEHGYR